jgi:hypothetical protein
VVDDDSGTRLHWRMLGLSRMLVVKNSTKQTCSRASRGNKGTGGVAGTEGDELVHLCWKPLTIFRAHSHSSMWANSSSALFN